MSKTESHVHPIVKAGKWGFDKLGAIVGLSFTALFFPLIAIIIKLDSKGPILFKQLRVGRSWPTHTELFLIVKFRTMAANAEAQGQAVWAKKADPRITRSGKFLRKTRLDELPQFYNVLRGDMSLIGPRPERPTFIQKLEKSIPFYVERVYGVAPGITGSAQVNLGYDEDVEDVRKKVAYDHAYALMLSKPSKWLMTDLRITLQTIKIVLLRRGQ